MKKTSKALPQKPRALPFPHTMTLRFALDGNVEDIITAPHPMHLNHVAAVLAMAAVQIARVDGIAAGEDNAKRTGIEVVPANAMPQAKP